jgi:hypothetical protein
LSINPAKPIRDGWRHANIPFYIGFSGPMISADGAYVAKI